MLKRLLLTFSILFSLYGRVSSQVALYVAATGNDDHVGTVEAPFRTLEKAVAAARGASKETIIYLREGDHRLTATIRLDAKDGNDERKLTIKSYPGEVAVINGAELLNVKWVPYRDGIFRTKIAKDQDIDMLIVSGNIRPLARYPNYDSTAVRFNGTSAEATSLDRIRSWKNPEGGFLHGMHSHDWGDFHYRITGKDKKGELMLEGGHQNNRQSAIHPVNRMVEKIFEELDAPAEWFYDKGTGWLYYYPELGEDIARATFEVPRLKHLIELRGAEQHPVKNILLDGLLFTGTTRTFMEAYEPLLRSDWTIYRGAAVVFEGTEHCEITNATFYNLGGNALFLSNFNREARIAGNHFSKIGASAICVVGDSKAVRSPSFEYKEFTPIAEMDMQKGPLGNNYPAFCLIEDNLIHNIGLFEKQIAGIELSMCYGITVAHNSVYDTPRAGINVSEGTWGGHMIEFNDVFDNVKETGDHGAFNSWGRDRFWYPDFETLRMRAASMPTLVLQDALSPTTLRNNRFRCDRGWDIDLDDGSSNYVIYNNLCLNGGIKLREGFYRVVTNNMLINNTLHPHVWFKASGDVFARNIVMSAYQPVRVEGWGAMVDYNIFADSSALAANQRNAVDQHSIVASLAFNDPATGDYRLSDSAREIFMMGFQNFDMDQFGVRSERLKKLARKPVFAIPIVAQATANRDNMIVWKGWRIKNLNSMGERSATGMDAERGVYVVGLNDFDSPIRDYLRSNDVILAISGRVVNTVEDLQKHIQRINAAEPQELTLFRNQKELKVVLPAKLLP